ncbi:MAG: hypothetical protein AAF497_25060 [Planctomycetota bacterium]
MKELNKPMCKITIGMQEDEDSTPENLAAKNLPAYDPFYIAATGEAPALPNRYTIGFKHRPLYYQQRNLERCGIGCGYFTNVVSGAKFVADTIVLPYRMGKTYPNRLVATDGDCQSCQHYPVKLNPLPFDCCGTWAEAATLAGFSFLLL